MYTFYPLDREAFQPRARPVKFLGRQETTRVRELGKKLLESSLDVKGMDKNSVLSIEEIFQPLPSLSLREVNDDRLTRLPVALLGNPIP